MNFLLHFLLARDDDDLRLGSLLGDVVKGRVERYDHPGTTPRLRTGIQLHRAIDSFSDQHPAVRRSKQRLAPTYGRLSGVIVDVFYDHLLARSWPAHHAQSLPDFTQDVYRTLRANLDRMPAAAHPLVHAMSRHDWLLSYAHIRGIDRALRGMAARAPIARGLATAAIDLERGYAAFAADFDAFLPELQAHAARVLAAPLHHFGTMTDPTKARTNLPPATSVVKVRAMPSEGDALHDTGVMIATRNHDLIREWARRQSAEPATGQETASGQATVDVQDGGARIRLNFPAAASFRPISWDEWFDVFERDQLVFVYEPDDTPTSTFAHHGGSYYRLVPAAEWSGTLR